MTKTAKSKGQMTPLMTQYFSIKSQHPDAVLLFRVGDFYETFGEDAIAVSSALGIVLTSRNNGSSKIELAGFPYHSLDVYLSKLVKAGFRVAICDQLEKPSKEKKLVKRGITDILTPGVTIDENILDDRQNNFLAAIHYNDKDIGIGLIDISTGEFLVEQGSRSVISKVINSFLPKEIILTKGSKEFFERDFSNEHYLYELDEWIFTPDYTRELLEEHFNVKNLKGFGVDGLSLAQISAGAILHYLKANHQGAGKHISKITRLPSEDFMWLDEFTIRNLELIRSTHPTGVPLIEILDQTSSPMGARMLRQWLVLPLISKERINNRLDHVQELMDNSSYISTLRSGLKSCGDLERLVSRISYGKCGPRGLLQLRQCLEQLNILNDAFRCEEDGLTKNMINSIEIPTSLLDKLKTQLSDDPPAVLGKPGIIKLGFHEELDDLKNTVGNSKELLIDIQTQEALNTGITNLKIGFNNVFGYYLEVTNKYKNQGLVPEHWVRKQTLTGSERYITDDLKKLETKILTAEDKILELESKLFIELIEYCAEYIIPLMKYAQTMAELDCYSSLATIAQRNNYCRPQIIDENEIDIVQGRHPVIEHQLPPDQAYIPNDVSLDDHSQQIIIITGPNMSGKSAVLRQTALVCLMAQMGSYVSAKSATLGITDKLFTRVGASDNITSGESTFMVEMNETASIMNNISERSLILLDEIGRGTSTYDGISIAWSIATFLHDHHQFKPKTLFATHYHELNQLADNHERIKNFNVATKEVGSKVLFLRTLERGCCRSSFGIHVASMAGMPRSIVSHANQILKMLEQKSLDHDPGVEGINPAPAFEGQLSIFDSNISPEMNEVIEELQSLSINKMTPIECMLKLSELAAKIKEV